MVQWIIELSQFDNEYKPRIAIKAQTLAEFIAKFTFSDPDPETEYWTVYTDSSSITGLRGVDVIMVSPEKDNLKYGNQLQFLVTNNEEEYEAILISLRVAKALETRNLRLKTDSKLIM